MANNCGYTGTTDYLMINWVHPIFLKANTAYFLYEYRKAACTDINRWYKIGTSDVIDSNGGIRAKKYLIVVINNVHCFIV